PSSSTRRPPPPSPLFPYTTLFRSSRDSNKRFDCQALAGRCGFKEFGNVAANHPHALMSARCASRSQERPATALGGLLKFAKASRSEERRVGKECRDRAAAGHDRGA